jgi:hypothetical protein
MKIEVIMMAKDNRDLLDVLKEEIDFIEKGGYGRSCRTPWKPKSVFLDSLTCLNYADPDRSLPCGECHLIDFVPPQHRKDELPCHSIPVSAEGATIMDLEIEDNQAKLERGIKDWLRARIIKVEIERLIAGTGSTTEIERVAA